MQSPCRALSRLMYGIACSEQKPYADQSSRSDGLPNCGLWGVQHAADGTHSERDIAEPSLKPILASASETVYVMSSA